MVSIASTLGIGSGIDTKALVEQLVAAQFEFKTEALTTRNETLTAQISSVAQLKSGMVGFSSALAALISGGSLSTQPTTSHASLLGVSLVAGAKLGGNSSEVEVRRLATSQLAAAAALPDQDAAVGKGTLTITLGTASFTAGAMTGFTARAAATPVVVTIADGDNSLVGLAAAINAANAGVTASVVSDANGARLSIKGGLGADAGFRIDVSEDAGAPGLAAFAFNPGSAGLSLGREALDSLIAVDGIEVARSSNSVSDLIAGVKLDLLKAELGTAITVGSARPTAAIGQAVSDFVAAFNELRTMLKTETDRVSGVLRGDSGARTMARQLGSLTSTALIENAAGDVPRTLAEIGVKTNRDGTLSVDTAKLNQMLADYPDAVEAMFNPRQTSSSSRLTVTSLAGKTQPGSYALADIVVAVGATPGSGTIAGEPATVIGDFFYAAATSAAAGLVFRASGDVASATITVDFGLGPALESIARRLTEDDEGLSVSEQRYIREQAQVAIDQAKADADAEKLRERLTRQFTAMDVRVAAYKATQDFLTQQIELWSADR